MKSADVERMYSSVCICISVWRREQGQDVLLVKLAYCVFSLWKLSAVLFRPLPYSSLSVSYTHDHWGVLLLWEGNSVVQFQYSRLRCSTAQYSTILRCITVDCGWVKWRRLSWWIEGVCWRCGGRGRLVTTTRCSYLMGGQSARCWCWNAGILLQEVSASSHRDPFHLRFNAKHFSWKASFVNIFHGYRNPYLCQGLHSLQVWTLDHSWNGNVELRKTWQFFLFFLGGGFFF